MEGQDWQEVVIRKKKPKPQNNDDAIRIAKQTGEQVEAVKKFNSGKNVNKAQPSNAKKLESETEELAHNRLGHDVALKIQQARLAMKMTQKELATKINEKPSIINEYESGRAIPNNQIMVKLERALGVKLR